MATFEDSFLVDLDELSDYKPELEENDDAHKEEEEEEEEEDETILTTFNYDDLDSLPNLQKTQIFSDIMQKVDEALDIDSEYKLIVKSNKLLVTIDKEIAILHSFIRHNYRLTSPELECIVPDAIDYARVVKSMADDDINLNLAHLNDLPPTAMVNNDHDDSFICGEPLPQDVQKKTIMEACDRVLDLDSAKNKVVDFVDIKTRLIAPNLSAVFGSKVATKLMVSAGGLHALAKMSTTSCVGQKRKRSFVGSLEGFLNETEIVQNTPPKYQDDACELLAARLTLAARVDSTRRDSSGAKGRALRDEVLEKIDKLQRHKLGGETQSKYFSEFGTFSKIKKSDLAGDKAYKF